jgi:hypothetical protein
LRDIRTKEALITILILYKADRFFMPQLQACSVDGGKSITSDSAINIEGTKILADLGMNTM